MTKITEDKITIIHGDVISSLNKIQKGSIKCCVTSPPYWKGFSYEAYFNSYAQYLEWTERWLLCIYEALSDESYLFLNVANDSETTIKAYELMNIATRQIMFKLHDTIIWYVYNRQPANTDKQLTNQHEFIFLLVKNSSYVKLYKKNVTHKEIFDTANVGNVWKLKFNTNREKGIAITQKQESGCPSYFQRFATTHLFFLTDTDFIHL